MCVLPSDLSRKLHLTKLSFGQRGQWETFCVYYSRLCGHYLRHCRCNTTAEFERMFAQSGGTRTAKTLHGQLHIHSIQFETQNIGTYRYRIKKHTKRFVSQISRCKGTHPRLEMLKCLHKFTCLGLRHPGVLTIPSTPACHFSNHKIWRSYHNNEKVAFYISRLEPSFCGRGLRRCAATWTWPLGTRAGRPPESRTSVASMIRIIVCDHGSSRCISRY